MLGCPWRRSEARRQANDLDSHKAAFGAYPSVSKGLILSAGFIDLLTSKLYIVFMVKVHADTKAKILNKAEALFRERSYSGFSYNDISRPLGIKNAAVHYHFPTKGDLGRAIIERYRRLLARVMRNTPENAEQARQQLEVLFEFEARSHAREQRVCPLAVLATDYANVSPDMQQQGQHLVQEMIQWLSNVLEVGRRHGAFAFDGPAKDKAADICATFLGARQISRVAREDHFTRILRQIRRDLGIH